MYRPTTPTSVNLFGRPCGSAEVLDTILPAMMGMAMSVEGELRRSEVSLDILLCCW